MKIIGLHVSFNSLSHDPSACLVVDGELICAFEEERFNRVKTSSGFFPEKALGACLQYLSLSINDIDIIACDGVTYPGMKAKLERYILDLYGFCPAITLINHATSHIAGAYYSSGFSDALCISVDGIGDKIATCVALVKDGKFEMLYEGGESASLGIFYTTFTNYLGFKSIEGEYKVMGMAAYGKPSLDLKNFVSFDRENGSLITSNEYSDTSDYTSIWEPSYNFEKILHNTGIPRRLQTSQKFLNDHFNLAASVQEAFRRAYVDLVNFFVEKTQVTNICLSGGCALNCLANKDLVERYGDSLFVMPAASDRGLSLGSAFLVSANNGNLPIPPKNMYLGKEYSDDEIYKSLTRSSLKFERISDPAVIATSLLKEGRVIGWFQGRSEFGPRALGHRSILASPFFPNMKAILNAKIKFRESYRPFAPAILEEDISIYTNVLSKSPYMTLIFDVLRSGQKNIPEALNVDGTARIQTVSKNDSYFFRKLLEELKLGTGIGAVINTSFNLAGEPIVETPVDALRTFISCDIDDLIIGSFWVKK